MRPFHETTEPSPLTALIFPQSLAPNLRSWLGMVLTGHLAIPAELSTTISPTAALKHPKKTSFDAARAAHVDHFVHTLPDGYDTIIDEDGPMFRWVKSSSSPSR